MEEKLNKSEKSEKAMGLFSATSIGVGAMIGAGIFALVGIAVDIAGRWAFLSFLIAGLIALLTTYSVSKLAVTYPSQGGRTEFINKSFGTGILSGSLNILMWIGYVIVTSLYARAFGEYGIALFGLEGNNIWLNILSSGIVFLFLLINFIGASLVGKSEMLMVIFKVGILLVFSFVSFTVIDIDKFGINQEISFSHVILAAGVIFMSYEGFGLVANTAEDLKNPHKNLPRALFISVLLVMIIYVLVSVAVIGNLSIEKILNAKEYVLGEAAEPVFGSFGFTVMAVTALISTASAINATIYGPVRMVQETAKANQLPSFFTRGLFGHTSGNALLVTGIAILIAVNFLSLESIAETGSLIFLIIYTSVNVGNAKIHEKTASKRYISILAAIATSLAFCALFYYEAKAESLSIYLLAALIILCVGFEWLYRKYAAHSV